MTRGQLLASRKRSRQPSQPTRAADRAPPDEIELRRHYPGTHFNFGWWVNDGWHYAPSIDPNQVGIEVPIETFSSTYNPPDRLRLARVPNPPAFIPIGQEDNYLMPDNMTADTFAALPRAAQVYAHYNAVTDDPAHGSPGYYQALKRTDRKPNVQVRCTQAIAFALAAATARRDRRTERLLRAEQLAITAAQPDLDSRTARRMRRRHR